MEYKMILPSKLCDRRRTPFGLRKSERCILLVRIRRLERPLLLTKLFFYELIAPLDTLKVRRIDAKIAKGHRKLAELNREERERDMRSEGSGMSLRNGNAPLSYETIKAKKAEINQKHHRLRDKRSAAYKRLDAVEDVKQERQEQADALAAQ